MSPRTFSAMVFERSTRLRTHQAKKVHEHSTGYHERNARVIKNFLRFVDACYPHLTLEPNCTVGAPQRSWLRPERTSAELALTVLQKVRVALGEAKVLKSPTRV